MSKRRTTNFPPGMLFEGNDPTNRRYLGTCFSFYSPKLFITAAHCIKDIPLDRLWVNHLNGPPPTLFERVQEPTIVDRADLAFFFADSPGTGWRHEIFRKTQYNIPLGEEVCVFGFPQEIFGSDPLRPTYRILRGFYQRSFAFRKPPLDYSAIELSFSCPEGFSGSPVFLESDPDIVVGVVTGNYESFTIMDTVTTTYGRVEETRKVISYGCAAAMFNLVGEFKKIFPKKFGINYPDPRDNSFVLGSETIILAPQSGD